VDGGVALDTVGYVVRAGAELLVAGNAVFGKGNVCENAKKTSGSGACRNAHSCLSEIAPAKISKTT